MVSKGSSRRAQSPRGRSANRSRSPRRPTSPSREHSSSPSRGRTLGRLSPSRGEPGHHRKVALKGPQLRIVVPRGAVMAQQHPQLHHLLPMLPRSCLMVPQEALAVAAYRCALAGRPPLGRHVPASTPNHDQDFGSACRPLGQAGMELVTSVQDIQILQWHRFALHTCGLTVVLGQARIFSVCRGDCKVGRSIYTCN